MDPGILTAVRGVAHAVAGGLGTVAATYTRGEDSASVNAVLTQAAAWQESPEDGISTRINQTQLLIDPDELDFGGGPVDPSPGDRIVMTVNGWTLTFDVRPPQSGEPCFAWVDPLHVRLRVHAKCVGRVPAESESSSSSSSPAP